MASQGNAFRAGETKGQAQEKSEQVMGKTEGTAQAAKDRAAQTAQAAKDRAVQTAQAAKDKAAQTAQAAKDKASGAAETGQTGKENTGGFLQQTGEQVKSAVAGAAEAVKGTLGMGGTETTTPSTDTTK